MAEKKFSINEAINFGWQATKENLGFLTLVTLLVLAASSIFSYASNKSTEPATFLINLLSLIVQFVLSIGLIKISLILIEKKKPDFSAFSWDGEILIQYFIGSLIYGLIVLVGLILLIIPGIIWGVKYQFMTYFIVDKKMNAIDALKESARLTSGIKWDLFIYGICIALIIFLGVICLFVGVLVALPVAWIATAFIYKKLSSTAKVSS